MLRFFRKSPAYADEEFAGLSVLFGQDLRDPAYQDENLGPRKLDFSLESLKHVDVYLETLHTNPPLDDNETVQIVLRCGAYVGEVIRKNSPCEWHWVTFEEAVRLSHFAKQLGRSLATAGILWRDPNNMCFPLGKICKFLEMVTKIAYTPLPRYSSST
jgi:hypothetical protein